jgi:phosphatidylglycerophosphate synthase
LTEPEGLAFKAYEIEELADVYFFRPLGMVVARAARALRLTPTFITVFGAIVGVAGGALLYDARLALAGFALIILHSILDSSDGQLARMTGRVTELGRLLDGIGGYATHAAIFIAIVAAGLARGAGTTVLIWAVLAAIASGAHAQMYDYHRSVYARVVMRRATRASRRVARAPAGPAVPGASEAAGDVPRGILLAYERAQAWLAGLHGTVEAAIDERSSRGIVRAEDRERYRAVFYWPVRGLNLLGDNTRFYAVGALAWLQHLDWFFAFVLVPMNAAFALLWLWQARADRRFLGGL